MKTKTMNRRSTRLFTLSCTLVLFAHFSKAQLDVTESVIQGDVNYEQYYDVAVSVFGPSPTLYYVGNGVLETSDIIVTKKSGTAVEWIRRYDSAGSEFGHRIIATADDGFAVTGWTTASGSDDLFVMKCDEDGTIEWTVSVGGSGIERGRGLDETSSGDIIVAGHSNTSSMGVNDILLVKVDADGNVLWQNRYGGSGNENGWDVVTLGDGSHIITGNTGTVGPGFVNMALMKVSADGMLNWFRGFGSQDGSTAATAMDIDFNENVHVSGWTDAAGAGSRDMYYAELDSDGDMIADATIGSTGFETSNGMVYYSAFGENVVLAGKSDSYDTSGEGLEQPLMVWMPVSDMILLAEAMTFGEDFVEGELFGVDIPLPMDFPGIATAGLAISDGNTDTYRFEGNNPGSCFTEQSIQITNPGFQFLAGGMMELDETAVTSPNITNSEITLPSVIDCTDFGTFTRDISTKVLTVYPNPTTDLLFFDGCENSEYRVIDISGKTIDQGIYNGDAISTTKWDDGIYLIKADECGTGKILVKH
ncbi:MAG: T9SS type A sorting domain-containing protein [Bacteroidota bacterium]